MSLIFTEYVRALGAGIDPTAEDFEAVLKKLEDALRRELKKRALWSAPPSYLGICGWSSWSAKEALEELVLDCYSYNFVRRLSGLQGLLVNQDNIEGVVFRNIENFVFEKQKQHDPVGYRVFSVLRTATRRLIARDELHVLEGNPRVDNATILAFSSASDCSRARPEDLSEIVRAWADELLPELITVRGAKLDAVIEGLCRCILRLTSEDIESFRFKDVVDPFKQAVRQRWNSAFWRMQGDVAFEEDEEGYARLVPFVFPDSDFEERQAHLHQLACVEEALDRLDVPEKTRDYLRKLWVFLRNHAAEPSADKRPSDREIAKLLNIPRDRLPGLREILGQLIAECLEDK